MGFMFCDLHVSLKYPFVGGYKFVEFVLLVMLHVGVCCNVVSDLCSLVVTCWERADLLAIVCVLCFVTFSVLL